MIGLRQSDKVTGRYTSDLRLDMAMQKSEIDQRIYKSG